MESSSPLSITSLLAAFCFLLLLLQHVLAAAARHLGSSSSCRPTTAFLPFHLPQPAPLHTPPPAPSQSHPLPSLTHSAIPEHMGMSPAGLHRRLHLCFLHHTSAFARPALRFL